MAEWKCEEVVDTGPCGWETSGWPTQELADKRGEEHLVEHETGEPMQELVDFQKENNVWPIPSEAE